MGAKLDADVAGALVLDAKPPEEEHERLFQLGVRSMRAGEYKKASTAFTQAVAAFPGGMTTRRGGEYSVWLAQARARHAAAVAPLLEGARRVLDVLETALASQRLVLVDDQVEGVDWKK